MFGGSFTGGAETQVGTRGSNTLIANRGVNAKDVLIGQQGCETLISDGGADVLYGAEGSDTLAIVSTDFRRVDGGNRSDYVLEKTTRTSWSTASRSLRRSPGPTLRRT